MKRLCVLVTHPIQYFAPMFALLSKSCNLKVFYTWGIAGSGEKIDTDFRKKIKWDIPLLDGYEYEFLENTAKNPGSHHFMGIQNPKVIDKIKDFNPSAILIYGWAYWSHLKVIRHFSGKIPIWFRGDSTLLDEKTLLKKLIRKVLLRWVYHYIDKAFYVGTANRAYFKKFGLKNHQLVFAPHAVDNDRFAEDRSIEANSIRKKLGVLDSDVLILFAGKLEWKKKPDLLFKVFLDINSNSAHLLFVGSGQLEESLKLEAKNGQTISENLKSRIHFMNFQNQSKMPALYQACNILCLPSETETWGLVINEAMAASKAILVSEKVGCAIDLINNENGIVFRNEEDLAKDLKELLGDKERLIKMGISSKKRITNWTFQEQVNTILEQLKYLKDA